MFPIIVNDGQTPFPDDDVFYIIGKEGVYLKKTLGVMDSIAPVKNISILESVQTAARMHVKKIPATQGKQILNFFKAVFKKYYAEAIVLLFYNIEKKHYKIVCPHQEVSAAGADYTKGITIDGYDMIGTIHSHARMSAFHSGIDDKDEDHFDGLHITFGDMDEKDISVSASIVANGHRVIVDPSDYLNNLTKTVDVDEEVKVPYARSWKWDKDKSKMVEITTTGRFYTKRKFDQRYQIQLSKDPKFPEGWMDRVEKKTWTASAAYGNHWAGSASWGEGSYWQNWRGHNKTKTANKTSNLPVVVKKDDKTPPAVVVEKKEETPCDACTFKNHKIGIALDQLDSETKAKVIEWALDHIDEDAGFKITESMGLEDAEDIIHYECVSCGSKFSVDETQGEGACSICQTGDYLIEITAAEMLLDDDEVETEDKTDTNDMSMVQCKECQSSFTIDFMVAGKCPTCDVVIDVGENNRYNRAVNLDSELDEDFIECPDCKRSIFRATLQFNPECQYCEYEFDLSEISTEERNISVMSQDSGDYLDPETEAIQAAIEADKDMERIPVPGVDAVPINKQPRKPGVFANLFNRRNKKK